MDQKLDGTFVTTEEDEELQRKFRAMVRPEHLIYGTLAEVGAGYLRTHLELFH